MSIFQSHLTDRAVIRLEGADRVDFLQNLVTQEVSHLAEGSCVMAALLTPQGKLLHDFLIFSEANCFLLDCDATQADALLKKLSLYKLRADIALDITDLQVHALWQEDGHACPPTAHFIDDPRHEGLGLRGLFEGAPESPLPSAPLAHWHASRIKLGVPQGPSDMPPGTVFPLEYGFAQLNAVDFQKGCFIGQEVTSRTHRKGTLRKKIHNFRLDGAPPSLGSDISNGTRVCGQIVAISGENAIALVREDALHDELTAEGTKLSLSGSIFPDTA